MFEVTGTGMPIEEAALLRLRDERGLDKELIPAQVFDLLMQETLAAVVKGYADAMLPTLSALGKFYLNASPDKQTEARAIVGFVESKGEMS